MADGGGGGDAEPEYSDETPLDHDSFFAMESLQAALQHLEALLRQADVSEASSSQYCDNFCQALMHHAGSRNSIEHGLALLEVYCLSINCFASARPHLTSSSSSVALVLKRLALSCFELLLSVPQNEIPLEAWLQFHGSVQAAHEAMLEYGSTDLQALVQITGEGGPWNNRTLVAVLTEQPTDRGELNAYLAFEGEDFLEMRIKQLEKVGELAKALVLTEACGNCPSLPGRATFLQTYVTQLCQQLPSEKAILEIARLDGKDVLEIICNVDGEGDESTAFVLCTTYFTRQLQQGSLYCSWELTLIWSKLQRRLDGSLESFLERCLQFGAIAKTVYHLLFLIRVIQTEAVQLGVPVAVELCVKALQLPKQEGEETKTAICRTAACLLPDDLEVLRACQLTGFLLAPSGDVFAGLEDLYLRPDQKYDGENAVISNSLRCELLFALKAHWPFDPEFWDWKTLKRHCGELLGRDPGHAESEPREADAGYAKAPTRDEDHGGDVDRPAEEKPDVRPDEDADTEHERAPKGPRTGPEDKFLCKMCQTEVAEAELCHHARTHTEKDGWACPACLHKSTTKQDLLVHSEKHLHSPPSKMCPLKKKKVKKRLQAEQKPDSEAESLSDGPGTAPPGLHGPVGALGDAAAPDGEADDDHITFDYIYAHYRLQDREVFPCPAADCARSFKLFKYLCVHMKTEHAAADPHVKHYAEMNNRREKCTFCRRTFVTGHHLLEHRPVHYGERPFTCLVAGCSGRFDSIHDLIAHKHGHGFRLAYHCSLKGCSLSFCDLGQLYHHEAQHFRDAAYTCTGPGCRKFYYSRREFLEHLDAHGISFTEKDFEAQRKRTTALPPDGPEEASGCTVDSKLKGVNGVQVHPVRSGSPSDDPGGPRMRVAVCFDGKTYTCGLEECGRTFDTAREIQKHLKIVHPVQLKDRPRCKGPQSEQHSKTTSIIKLEARDQSPTPGCSSSNQTPSALNDTTPVSNPSARVDQPDLNDLLAEIVLRLGQLSLRSAVHRDLRRTEKSWRRASKPSPVTDSRTGDAAQPSNAALSEIKLVSDVKETGPPSDAGPLPEASCPETGPAPDAPKPFACEVNDCSYTSVTSLALKVHYAKKHGYSQDHVKNMGVFDPHFRPFRCRLCRKTFKEKKQLKKHLLIHGKTDDLLGSPTCIRTGGTVPEASATQKTSEVPVERNDLPIRNGIPLNGNHRLKLQTIGTSKRKVFSCQRKGCGKLFSRMSSVNRHVRKRCCLSEEPIPRFKCAYANCSETYHLRSSLLRHTSQMHQNQAPPKPRGGLDPADLSGSLVVRLQSTQRRGGSESGCQRKLIVAPVRSVKPCRTVEDVKAAERPDVRPKFLHELVYRTPEEALQMCQDRCLPVAYPCMIKECVSVVSTARSLHRHYVKCHQIVRTTVCSNRSKLFYTAEKLEELIHRKSTVSALPDSARVPSGVLKMEYQAEPENPEASCLRIKSDPVSQEAPPHERNALYGESDGPPEDVLTKETTDETPRRSAPPLDLSPPSNLRIRCTGAPVDAPGRESKPVAPATIYIHANPARQPLKWKNSVLSELPPHAPRPPDPDCAAPGSGPQVFDLGVYRPLGFESSFLRFIRDKDETVSAYTDMPKVVVLNPARRPDPPRGRASFRRKYSVKENKLRAEGLAHGRIQSRIPTHKPLLPAVELGSVKNLRFILETASMGCGDQAIKQLRFLKPVVVLERPKSSASPVQTGE